MSSKRSSLSSVTAADLSEFSLKFEQADLEKGHRVTDSHPNVYSLSSGSGSGSGSGSRRSGLNRKGSKHSLFTIREKVPAGDVLPVLYKTLSYQVENSQANRSSDTSSGAGNFSWGLKTFSSLFQGVSSSLFGKPASGSATNANAALATSEQFANITFHTDSIDSIVSQFSSSLEHGLTTGTTVSSHLKTYGYNIQSKPAKHLLKKTFMYFFGGFGGLLFAGGILCIVCWKPLGNPAPAVANLVLGVVLLLVFLCQALFNFFQDYSSSRVMESINSMIPEDCLVIRDGGLMSILDSKLLVPGDIVCLKPGSKVPADCRIVQSSGDLSFDRSILTGETMPVVCTVVDNSSDSSNGASAAADSGRSNYLESTCIAMQGTFVTNGSGRGIVVATGDNTVFGIIAKMSSKPRQGMTTIQKEILRFVVIISCVILCLIVLFCILWATWLRVDYPGWISVANLIVDCVTVAVAFIPEGLPVALTTCLLITASRMRKNLILCKSLAIIETLGSVSVLCFDKTGTLTKNDMVVVETLSELADCEEGGDSRTQTDVVENDVKNDVMSQDVKSYGDMSLFLAVSSLCNDAVFSQDGQINGNATDRAILQYTESFVSQSVLSANWRTVFSIPFNSKDKYMAKVVEREPGSEGFDLGVPGLDTSSSSSAILMVKGAPDILLTACSNVITRDYKNGSVVTQLDAEKLQRIKKVQENWSKQGRRVILVAAKQLPADNGILSSGQTAESIDKVRSEVYDLTLVGLLAIEDPPRDGIDQIIERLRLAGIKIAMITGDFELTGVAISKKVGIVRGRVDNFDDLPGADSSAGKYAGTDPVAPLTIPRAISLTGKDLMKLSASQWDHVVRYEELVFTRTTPEQKLLIIEQFQLRNHVIGMTGDGVNDSPSLKQADVGISLINASDVAKEASDLILMDSDRFFVSLLEALKLGRLVFENLRKTIAYLLPAGTFAELWTVLLNIIFGFPQILSSFCMIFICCITDCAGAINLAYEDPERNLLTKKPRSISGEHLVDMKLFLHSYFTVGTFYAFTSFLLAFIHLKRQGFEFSVFDMSYGSYLSLGSDVTTQLNVASSIYFNNLVIMQFFNLMAMRTRYLSVFQQSPLKNKGYLTVIPIALGSTFVVNYVGVFHNVLGTGNVPVEYYFISLGFGLVVLIYDELRKLYIRGHQGSFLAKIAW